MAHVGALGTNGRSPWTGLGSGRTRIRGRCLAIQGHDDRYFEFEAWAAYLFLRDRRSSYKTPIDPKTVSSARLDPSDAMARWRFKAEGSNKLTVHLNLT
jgi:hypothetical protein